MVAFHDKVEQVQPQYKEHVALYLTFPLPTGEVDTFFFTVRLTTNLSDGI